MGQWITQDLLTGHTNTCQKSLIEKKEQDFSPLLKKKHGKKQCQDVDIKKKIFQEKMLFTYKDSN